MLPTAEWNPTSSCAWIHLRFLSCSERKETIFEHLNLAVWSLCTGFSWSKRISVGLGGISESCNRAALEVLALFLLPQPVAVLVCITTKCDCIERRDWLLTVAELLCQTVDSLRLVFNKRRLRTHSHLYP